MFFQVSARAHIKLSMCEMRSIWEWNCWVFPSEKSPSVLDWNEAAAAAATQTKGIEKKTETTSARMQGV